MNQQHKLAISHMASVISYPTDSCDNLQWHNSQGWLKSVWTLVIYKTVTHILKHEEIDLKEVAAHEKPSLEYEPLTGLSRNTIPKPYRSLQSKMILVSCDCPAITTNYVRKGKTLMGHAPLSCSDDSSFSQGMSLSVHESWYTCKSKLP